MSSLTCCRLGGSFQLGLTSSSLLSVVRYNKALLRSIHTSRRHSICAMSPSIIRNGTTNGNSPPMAWNPIRMVEPNNGHTSRPFSSAPAAGGPVETEFLIVGAGPSGAALACFLTSYGKVAIPMMITSRTDKQRPKGSHDQHCSRDGQYTSRAYYKHGSIRFVARTHIG